MRQWLQGLQSQLEFLEQSMVDKSLVSRQEAKIRELETQLEFERTQVKRLEALWDFIRAGVLAQGGISPWMTGTMGSRTVRGKRQSHGLGKRLSRPKAGQKGLFLTRIHASNQPLATPGVGYLRGIPRDLSGIYLRVPCLAPSHACPLTFLIEDVFGGGTSEPQSCARSLLGKALAKHKGTWSLLYLCFQG
ncbi:unnamed protein product [Caretta caretta]